MRNFMVLRLVSRAVVVIFAIALVILAVPRLALAYNPNDPNSIYEEKVRNEQAMGEVSRKAQLAGTLLAQVEAEVLNVEFVKIPAAIAAATAAQKNYDDAVEKAERVARRLKAAEEDKERIEKQLDLSTKDVDSGKVAIGSSARHEMQNKDQLDVFGAFVGISDTEGFISNLESQEIVTRTSARLLDSAVFLKADALNKNARLEIVGELIDKLKKQADENKEKAEKAKAEAESWQKQVEQMKVQLAQQKADLEYQKKNLDSLLAQLREQNNALNAAWALATNNGTSTSGSVGPFKFRNYSGESFCGGGYPGVWCGATQDSLVDDWALYNRECVSFAAWKIARVYGRHVARFAGHGNARDWPTWGPRLSGASISYSPVVGAAAINTSLSYWGHAMVVDSITSDGWARISQYNWNGHGTYSTVEISPDSAVYVVFN